MLNLRFRYISLSLVLFALVACGSNSTVDNTDIDLGFRPIFLTSTIDSVQPTTGIVFWENNQEALLALGDTVQLEFSYMLYSDIVKQEGVYDWDQVDTLLNEIADRKHQAILRFRYAYPGYTEVSVPDYIVNSPNYNFMIETVESADTFLPDWSSGELASFTLQFFVDFAERYDGDPRIAVLQVGFGSYAEYHLFDGPISLGGNFPSKDFQTSFVSTMNQQFNITQWAISIDAANDDFTPFSTNEAAKNASFGLFDDSLMHQTHSENDFEYNRASWLFFGVEKFHNNMMGGEFSYYSDYDQQNVLSLPDGPWGRNFESFSEQYHLSYVIGNDQFLYQAADRIKEASMAMGYRFNIDKFEASETQSRISVSNTGNAPIYYDAFVTINGVRSSNSLRGLLPGESQDYLVESGGTNPILSIESDYIVDGQVIAFSASL